MQAEAGFRLALLWALMSCTALAAAETRPIRFAPLPMEDPKIIQEQIGGLIDFLSDRAELPIRWTEYSDYGAILAAFRAGEVDLTYLGPLPYAILRRDSPQAVPLGCFRDADGDPSYTCSLVAFGDDALHPGAIRGMRIGLTQPYSTCGWLAVSEMLRAAGRALDGDGNSFRYACSHSQAALGVVRGEFDVAGVKTAIAHRYAHLNLARIAESERWPGFALVANRATLTPAQLARLRAALQALDLEQNPDLHEFTADWGAQVRNGIVPAQRCDYSAVVAALGRLPWPIPGSATAAASASRALTIANADCRAVADAPAPPPTPMELPASGSIDDIRSQVFPASTDR